MRIAHCQLYGVVMVIIITCVCFSRNLERANENDGFKMTALEMSMIHKVQIATRYVDNYGYGYNLICSNFMYCLCYHHHQAGESALVIAARHDCVEVCRTVLLEGADHSVTDEVGSSGQARIQGGGAIPGAPTQ